MGWSGGPPRPGCLERLWMTGGLGTGALALQSPPLLPCSVLCPLVSSWFSHWGHAGAQGKKKRYQVIHCPGTLPAWPLLADVHLIKDQRSCQVA